MLTNQLKLDRFSEGKITSVKLNNEEKNKLRNKLNKETNYHLKKAIIAISNTTPGSSFPFSDIINHLQKVVRTLEKDEILYNKNYKGTRRLYKKFCCHRDLSAWRKCPESICLVYKNGSDFECPYEKTSNV